MCDTGGGYQCHQLLKQVKILGQSGPGDAFTSPPLRFTLYPLLGHCLTRRVWGQYFPLSAREGVDECVCVCEGGTKEGGYQCSAASSDEAVKVEAVKSP